MVKTTITIDDELWKKFSIKVIENYGGRSKTDVIEALVNEFAKDPSRFAEVLGDWMKDQRKRKAKT
jgi:predicted CopG family antitoxin